MPDFSNVEQMHQQIIQQQPVKPMVMRDEFNIMPTMPVYKRTPEEIMPQPSTFHQTLIPVEPAPAMKSYTPPVQVPQNRVQPTLTKNQSGMKSAYSYLFE
jgi:hypothetical protein